MNDGSEAARGAVRRYVAALRQMRERLFAGFPDLSGVPELMAAVRSARTLPREGRSSTGVEYLIHGAGCRMTDEDGREVDVDVHSGVEAFDALRVKWFLGESNEYSVTQLREACSHLAGLGELIEVEPHESERWYALPELYELRRRT